MIKIANKATILLLAKKNTFVNAIAITNPLVFTSNLNHYVEKINKIYDK